MIISNNLHNLVIYSDRVTKGDCHGIHDYFVHTFISHITYCFTPEAVGIEK